MTEFRKRIMVWALVALAAILLASPFLYLAIEG